MLYAYAHIIHTGNPSLYSLKLRRLKRILKKKDCMLTFSPVNYLFLVIRSFINLNLFNRQGHFVSLSNFLLGYIRAKTFILNTKNIV